MLSHGELAAGAGNAPTVTLTADVAPFENSLDRAADISARVSQRIEQQMTKAARGMEQQSAKFSQSIKDRFQELEGRVDKVTSLIGFGVKGALAGLAAKGVESLVNLATGADRFNKELERTEKLIAKTAEALDRLDDERAKWLDVEARPRDNLPRIAQEIDRLEAERAGVLKNKMDAQRKRDALTANPGSPNFKLDDRNKEAFQLWIAGRLEDEQKRLDAVLKGFADRDEKLQKRIQDLRTRKNKVADPDTDDQAVRTANKMADAIRRQGETFGMSADQAARYNAELDNLSKKQIKMIEDAERERNAVVATRIAAWLSLGIFKPAQEKAKAADARGVSALMGGSSEAASAVAAAARSSFSTQDLPQVNELKRAVGVLERIARVQEESRTRYEETLREIQGLREDFNGARQEL